jgi:hypothetical protein
MVEPLRIVLGALRFLMKSEKCRDQHGDSHCGSEHHDQHGLVSLASTMAVSRLNNGGVPLWFPKLSSATITTRLLRRD